MAQAAATASNAIEAHAVAAAREFTGHSVHKGFTIIVQEQFLSDSKLLTDIQVKAIDEHAVSIVEKDTFVDIDTSNRSPSTTSATYLPHTSTAQTSRPSSESALTEPTFLSTSTVPDRGDIIHAPTGEITNLTPLSASTSKADMMNYLKLDKETHGLLLRPTKRETLYVNPYTIYLGKIFR
ncbi:hypothetical protein PtrEW4_010772 [Pyrenophora tritici-repentis]|nr:hypothetical protein PtrEW4_010772 [Pyrenophora tritici-repentis]